MIGYLEGKILHSGQDHILLLAGNTGYEITVNPRLVEKLVNAGKDDMTALYIYYHQTERQPKPVLIGFETFEEKQFFQIFITVAAIGPLKAVKAMSCPAGDIALAIENKDVKFLTGLNGIGKRTAEKIIATLHGKLEKFVILSTDAAQDNPVQVQTEKSHIADQVADVLVEQLGHSPGSARRMIAEALARNTMISTPEELFDEIFRENQ
jgi:Holliday junction DNA helicase RuvA